ncbi:3'-5' exonuclease KapD [Acididesulfobacillus acetoxydans]|uniref:3'-5' exonuclease KapD n=1 Tax=Acididesulfobacillus acetoxydans TaxID=1561005 RepID=UPI0021C1462A|nr:3'-5' exonuclease KapD [Acididesulfobacillus acetoxydans]
MEFLCVDFEFSVKRAFGSPRAWFPEIIEVGGVRVSAEGELGLERYGAFVKPRFWPRLGPDCYGITGIRQEDVDQGVSLEDALPRLKDLAPAPDTWLVAWGDADRRILGHVCEQYGLEYPYLWENYCDLAESYKNFAQLERTASLKTAVTEMKVEQVGILHSALDDAVNAALVMQKMLAQGWSAERASLIPESGKKKAGGHRGV